MQFFFKIISNSDYFNNPQFLKEKEKLNRQYQMIKPIYNLYMIIFYLKFTKNKSLKLNNKTNTNPIRNDKMKRNVNY